MKKNRENIMGIFSLIKKKSSIPQNKMTNVGNCLNEYVVFDIESTGLSKYYSEIVQLSAIKIRNGQIVDVFDSLIKPHKPIPNDAILIHHITNEMVASVPTFVDVIDDFLNFIRDSILIGYNISRFDLLLLKNRMFFEKRRTFNARYIDVFLTAKQLPTIDHKLTSIAEYYGIKTDGAHNALTDCKMTDKCYHALSSDDYNFEVRKFKGAEHVPQIPLRLSSSSQSILILRSIMGNIIADGFVEKSEFHELAMWIHENEYLRGEYPFDSISKKIESILEDGIVQTSELDELAGFIDEWLDPVGHAKHIALQTLQGIHVVLTGDFEYGDKSSVEAYVLSKGAIIDKSTTKKTQLVIVGALGSNIWAAGNYGNKIKKALENREKGQKIELIKEDDFFKEAKKL